MAGKKKKSFRENFREKFRGKKRGYIIITVFFLALLLFYPGNNLITYVKTHAEIRSQRKLIRKYQIEIMEMESRIRELATDRDTLEKFARENFHFAKPGEDVYLVR